MATDPVLDPQSGPDRGYDAPLYPGSANMRKALTRGQELLVTPTTRDGATGMTFPGLAFNEEPTGGGDGLLRFRNLDKVSIRVRRMYMTIDAAGGVQGQIQTRFRIGTDDFVMSLVLYGYKVQDIIA